MKTENDNWALLMECKDDIKLEAIKSELKEANIPFTVINKKDSSFLIGNYEIFVHVEMISSAKSLLKGMDVNF
jgi:hypothetical protein